MHQDGAAEVGGHEGTPWQGHRLASAVDVPPEVLAANQKAYHSENAKSRFNPQSAIMIMLLHLLLLPVVCIKVEAVRSLDRTAGLWRLLPSVLAAMHDKQQNIMKNRWSRTRRLHISRCCRPSFAEVVNYCMCPGFALEQTSLVMFGCRFASPVKLFRGPIMSLRLEVKRC